MLRNLSIITFSFLMIGQIANAQVTWYDDESTWLTETINPSLIDFDNLSLAEVISMQFSGVTFSSTNTGQPHVDDADPGAVVPKSSPNNMRVRDPNLGGGDWKATLSSPRSAVGFWVWDLECVGFPESKAILKTQNGGTIEKNICEIHSASAGQDWRFIGVTSNDTIVSIEVIPDGVNGTSGDFMVFDNFSTATSIQSIPAISTWGLSIMIMLIIASGTLVFRGKTT